MLYFDLYYKLLFRFFIYIEKILYIFIFKSNLIFIKIFYCIIKIQILLH